MTEKSQLEQGKKLFEKVHNRIYGEISILLKFAKLNTLEIIKERTPTYTDVADYLKDYFEIVILLSKKLNTPDYVIRDLSKTMEDFTLLAKSIDEDDLELMTEAVSKLDDNCRL